MKVKYCLSIIQRIHLKSNASNIVQKQLIMTLLRLHKMQETRKQTNHFIELRAN